MRRSQVYLTALIGAIADVRPSVDFHPLIPDLDHYKGSFGGRVFPLWRDAAATQANLPPKLLEFLTKTYKMPVTPEDFLAYLAAVAANPAYTARFQTDLAQPGLRIPLTARPKLFAQAVEVGRRVIWLHTFGERYVDAKADRPPGPPRLAERPSPTHSERRRHPGRCRHPCPTKSGTMRAESFAGRQGFVDNVPGRGLAVRGLRQAQC